MKTRAIATFLAGAAVSAGVADAAHNQPTKVTALGGAERIKIYGCAAEDSCAIDYRADRGPTDANGDGVWIIRRQVP